MSPTIFGHFSIFWPYSYRDSSEIFGEFTISPVIFVGRKSAPPPPPPPRLYPASRGFLSCRFYLLVFSWLSLLLLFSFPAVLSPGYPRGVLVPLFPSKIGLCSLFPAIFSHLFPAFLICSPFTPLPLNSWLGLCFKICHSD